MELGRRVASWGRWRALALATVFALGVAAAVIGPAAARSLGDRGGATTTTTATPAARAALLPDDPVASTIAPVCGDQDGSEPLVFDCSQFTPAVDQRYYQVPGAGPVTVDFDYVYKDALCDNQLAVFRVDDASGSIGGVLPGDPAWPAAVAGRAQVVFGSGSSPFTPDVDLTFQGGDLLGLRFTGCGTFYYSYEQANPDGFDHLLAFRNVAGQPYQFAWEDTFGGGDHDFNDLIANVSVGGGVVLPAGSYVALGDSYSSGEGNPPFFDGTDGPSDYCHRSPFAYPILLGLRYGSLPLFYACSGATTQNIENISKDGEPPQFLEPGVDSSARLLTMTIGGNDAGFSSVLTACIEQKLKADAYNDLIGPIAAHFFGHDPSCAHSGSFTSSVDADIENIFWLVKLTERGLLSKTDATKTSIIVADYPYLFPATSDERSCLSLSLILTDDDMTWMNSEGDHLDGVLQEAAAEAGVNFVDVRNAFLGHAVCGSGGSWLNGISIASGSGNCTWSLLGVCWIPGGLPIIGSFHPNASGHADGYAASIASYIDSATVRTANGLPANPPPTPDPPSTPAPSAAAFGELTVQPVTPNSADCEGTYQAGQLLLVSGDGFAPGASVQVVVSAGGLPPSGERVLTTLTADPAGHVDGEVRIPLTATGFGPIGATAGMLFLDALGAGATADYQDDIAMTGLAPHDSSCGAVDPLPFDGFFPPVANPPKVNQAQPGRAVPVKFSVAGADGTIDDVLAAGYPQSTPVSCTAPGAPVSGDPTASSGAGSSGGQYNYLWKTDRTWSGCRALIVKLVDGSYHRAFFDFGP
jgi:hypothetical protein